MDHGPWTTDHGSRSRLLFRVENAFNRYLGLALVGLEEHQHVGSLFGTADDLGDAVFGRTGKLELVFVERNDFVKRIGRAENDVKVG